ncbi:putative F-box and FNIP repeat-containing protein [Acanthamoeba polyphaga mimivirus]|uniref:F-box and FNIP repeat-containing protein n=1 Tax=Acanthamoeba polyphaga mimivirus Kroon TaxID=3069720 RepID=A0A0G2YAB7_9VIRU|nr:putative F-box and FNIP repeat-containing protein [Acanthamoeba polyphaga mimivirus]AKI80021.1 putative F-box and FNIP repeat-containing protein [Acanthamoeba polyphaga mimivirus Kroon]
MSLLNVLESHVILHIIEFLSDHEKIKFMSTCKSLYEFRCHITYNNFYVYDTINHLGFVNKFKKLIHLSIFDESPKNYGPTIIVKSIKDIIPPNTTCIIFDDDFDEDITDFIPEGIKYVVFGFSFNQSIRNILPCGLIELRLGYNFRQSIDDIPNTITKIIFDSEFIPVIHGKIPNNITCLSIGGYFGKIHKKDIPNNIKHLIIGTDYHSKMCEVIEDSIDMIITENVTHITLGWNFDDTIFNIPNGVTHLILYQKFNPIIIKYLPSSVKHVEFISRW